MQPEYITALTTDPKALQYTISRHVDDGPIKDVYWATTLDKLHHIYDIAESMIDVISGQIRSEKWYINHKLHRLYFPAVKIYDFRGNLSMVKYSFDGRIHKTAWCGNYTIR
jgi:hypothetical protein